MEAAKGGCLYGAKENNRAIYESAGRVVLIKDLESFHTVKHETYPNRK